MDIAIRPVAVFAGQHQQQTIRGQNNLTLSAGPTGELPNVNGLFVTANCWMPAF
jgi:hypothetical protein